MIENAPVRARTRWGAAITAAALVLSGLFAAAPVSAMPIPASSVVEDSAPVDEPIVEAPPTEVPTETVPEVPAEAPPAADDPTADGPPADGGAEDVAPDATAAVAPEPAPVLQDATFAAAAPTLTVSPATGLSRDGQTVTVSGTGYDPAKAIYVAVCEDRDLSTVNFDMFYGCLGARMVTATPGSASQVPMAADGSFSFDFARSCGRDGVREPDRVHDPQPHRADRPHAGRQVRHRVRAHPSSGAGDHGHALDGPRS